jgi:hypothetical protein
MNLHEYVKVSTPKKTADEEMPSEKQLNARNPWVGSFSDDATVWFGLYDLTVHILCCANSS